MMKAKKWYGMPAKGGFAVKAAQFSMNRVEKSGTMTAKLAKKVSGKK